MERPEYYKIGDVFIGYHSRSPFMLSQVNAGEFLLIGLDGGNRWTSSTLRCEDSQKISAKAFHKHFDTWNTKHFAPKDRWSWKLVDKPSWL
jgi:hypothetical protein